MDDIAGLIEQAEAKPSKLEVGETRFGELSGLSSPCGVSLIVSQSDSALRWAVAPLAASIAARNTVVLATTGSGRFFKLFEQHTGDLMDASAIHIVEAALEEIDESQVDHVLIIGQ